MLALLVDTAREDENIRAVVLNGSRANPNARRDPFQDFDVVYVVTEVAPFARNETWIERFGELMILQTPDDMGDPAPAQDGAYVYLMQFTDGNRIDLSLKPLNWVDREPRDSLSVVLLDKDGLFEGLPPPSERDYLPRPPSAKAYADCCNEFWWVCPYVVKGLWRGEILHAKQMHDRYVRDQLIKMAAWYVGLRTEFAESPGKFGKNLERHLEPGLWQMLLETYADADYQRTWDALLATCELFRILAQEVADHFGFEYRHVDDERVTAHLEHVRRLPPGAEEIYL
jgi:aminoglycoside 6-adenylyltransferase